jgi:butyrate response factor 1
LMHCEATRGGKKKQFNNAEERIQFRQTYESKKKTELCRNFEMYGTCRYGNTCSYAHGSHQL